MQVKGPFSAHKLTDLAAGLPLAGAWAAPLTDPNRCQASVRVSYTEEHELV